MRRMQKKKILQSAAEGKIDLLIGTHALLLSSGRGTYGEISAILTPAALESAWQMDVVGWLRSLGNVWQE